MATTTPDSVIKALAEEGSGAGGVEGAFWVVVEVLDEAGGSVFVLGALVVNDTGGVISSEKQDEEIRPRINIRIEDLQLRRRVIWFWGHYNRLASLQSMFGPLNGVRTALVAGAALAAIAAFFSGFMWAGLVLLAGVGIHGLGWLYLYNQRAKGNVEHS